MSIEKKFLIEVSQSEEGEQTIKYSNAGFTDLELIGICEVLRVQNIVKFRPKTEQIKDGGK